MKILIIVNQISGSGPDSGFSRNSLCKEFSKYGTKPEFIDISVRSPNELLHYIHDGNYDVVAASGGDGTINMVAGLLAGKEIALGILPAGTLNHFAKDLNIPLTPEGSVSVIANGNTTLIDTAEVNGRLFLNNSSIGFYPLALKKRNAQQLRFGRSKWLSMFYGLYTVFKRFPLYAVRINTGKEISVFRTPILFVGNNEYSVELLTIGSRKLLTGGKLCLYYLKSNTRFRMFKVAIAAFFNMLKESDELEMKLIDEVEVESAKKKIHVSIDGEVEEFAPPLHYKVISKNLKVVIPRNI